VGQQAGRTSRALRLAWAIFAPFSPGGRHSLAGSDGRVLSSAGGRICPTLWRTRPASPHGPWDKTFLFSALVMAVFFYLSVSSFWRARKR